MKGRSAGGWIVTLVLAAIGIKIITWLSNSYISQADTGMFSDLIASFARIGDLLFYGLLVLAALLIPVYLQRRKKNVVPSRPRPVERE